MLGGAAGVNSGCIFLCLTERKAEFDFTGLSLDFFTSSLQTWIHWHWSSSMKGALFFCIFGFFIDLKLPKKRWAWKRNYFCEIIILHDNIIISFLSLMGNNSSSLSGKVRQGLKKGVINDNYFQLFILGFNWSNNKYFKTLPMKSQLWTGNFVGFFINKLFFYSGQFTLCNVIPLSTCSMLLF